MNIGSIRFRLAAWYTAVLAAALAVFGVVAWLAVRQVLYHSADESLRDRVGGVRKFMNEQIGALSVEEIRDEFKEHSVLGPGGDLFQVCDRAGTWLYRSAALEGGDVGIALPNSLGADGTRETRVVGGVALRFLARRVEVLGKPYTVQVAVPMGEINEGLEKFAWALLILTPAVLCVASVGGWWMSRRALEPVDGVIAAARAIGEQSLSRRLPVPGTRDELQRLSETLNQMLDRIEGAFRRITEFTADASHELRTPVALMRTTAELALRKPRVGEEYRQALAEVHEESVRTTDLIEDLLTLARADAGKAQLDRREVDLAAIVREASDQGEKLARAKGLSFDIEVPARPVKALADASALRRLLLIVIDNAVKYSQEGGVKVRLEAEGGRSRVQVTDTGVGIPDEDMPRIFERFYRSDKSRNRDAGGAGLGLSIAKWIAEVHEGTIACKSEPGRGSTFVITLPGTGR